MTLLPAMLLLAAAAGGAEGRRAALLVANDAGLAHERPLRFTGADAERLAAVLRELGGFAPEDVRVLKQRTAAEVLDAVDLIARDPPAMLLFYFSGHADAAALHQAGTVLPLDLLLHRLRNVPAELRIVLLDACQSGAGARAKGSRPAAPFEVHPDDQASTGDILISSSAADEQSFEGEHGGLFTLHWVAGLRGAADANGNGQVTLAEAYEYAYAQALRATLAAPGGPQHARFRFELAGRRDPVLTRLAGGALLTLQPQAEGEYVLFDGRERSVVAELPSRPGEPRRLALPPGGYVVQQRTTRSVRLARIQLAPGDDRALADHQMQEVPLLRLARKGSLGERHLTAGAGQQASGFGPRGHLLGSVGVEWEGPRRLVGLDLSASSGTERHAGLATSDRLAQASGLLLVSVHLGSAALRLGPAAGVGWLRQAPRGREVVQAVGLSLGMRARADLQVTPGLGIVGTVDGRFLAARARERPSGGTRAAGIGVAPWGSYTLGVRAAF